MSVYLVRHAKAGDRDEWSGTDHLRPLSRKGRTQAEGLVEHLGAKGVTRILSSSYLRCVQTVEPLARQLDLKVEEHDDLVEGTGPERLAAMLRDLVADGERAVLCTHGDVIPMLLDHLVRTDGLALDGGLRCAKGSTWVLEPDGSGRFRRGGYLSPPPDA